MPKTNKRRRGTHIKANAPSMRAAKQEAARSGQVDVYKLALTLGHRGGEKMLRSPAAPVEEIGEEIRFLCARMIDVVRRDPKCLGLSAPQVNRSLRIIVVKNEDGMVYCFINPTWKPLPEAVKQTENEGCFSLPGQVVRVERFTAVEVTGLAPFGQESTMVFSGITARAVQHECDHLEGCLIDQLGSVGMLLPA